MKVFVGMIAFATSFLFFALFIYKRDENRRYRDAAIFEGHIIELVPARHGTHYPVVEYTYHGEKRSFRNTLSLQGAIVGQRLDVEVSADGRARVGTMGNDVVQYFLLGFSVAGLLFGLIMVIQGESI